MTTRDFSKLLLERNMLAQVAHPEEFSDFLTSGKRVAYAGFDPTAESFHVGNLMPIMALRRWQQAGHKAVVLMGGATAMIGDPTGKTELRQMLTTEMIDARVERLKKQFGRFLDLSPENFLMTNNADWFREMKYLPLLREIGADFTVNRMLAAECFKQRYEKGLSFLEFNYMILQSYDFLQLFRDHDVTVQLGGDDQWSNMIGGMDLIRRKERTQAFICTVPLLVTSGGKKMGKTEDGAVWLDSSMTSPYELFQYFRNVADDSVEKCLFYFTDLPATEITERCAKRDASINETKSVLAYEVTKLIHGELEANKALEQSKSLFGGAGGTDAPVVNLDRGVFGEGLPIFDALVLAKICDSKSEAKRLLEQGAITVNDQKISDSKWILSKESIGTAGALVRKGKKHFYKLKIGAVLALFWGICNHRGFAADRQLPSDLPGDRILFTVYDAKSDKPLSEGEETIAMRGDVISKSTIYRTVNLTVDPTTFRATGTGPSNSKLLQEESVVFNVKTLVPSSYQFSNGLSHEKVSMTNDGRESNTIVLKYKADDGAPEESKTVKWGSDYVLGKTLHHLIVRAWPDLMQGSAKSFSLFVPMKQDRYQFRVISKGRKTIDGNIVTEIALEMDNWALRQLAPRMSFYYQERAGLPVLTRYEGPTTVVVDGDSDRKVYVNFKYEISPVANQKMAH